MNDTERTPETTDTETIAPQPTTAEMAAGQDLEAAPPSADADTPASEDTAVAEEPAVATSQADSAPATEPAAAAPVTPTPETEEPAASQAVEAASPPADTATPASEDTTTAEEPTAATSQADSAPATEPAAATTAAEATETAAATASPQPDTPQAPVSAPASRRAPDRPGSYAPADAERMDPRLRKPALYKPRMDPGQTRFRPRQSMSDISLPDIHYKNVEVLIRFIDGQGRILPRRKTRISAKMQRRVKTAIKQARHLALLPYTPGHIRSVRRR